ncbi:MAG: hypothetical protein ACR2KN_04835 [Geodermatophilaceae bacterium]
MSPDSHPPRVIQWAAALVAVEGAAVLAAAAVLCVATLVTPPDSYAGAASGIALGLVFGAAILRLALGLRRLEAWSRGPVVVTQLLLVPVGYTFAVNAGMPVYGVPILLVCVAVLGLLFSPGGRMAMPGR